MGFVYENGLNPPKSVDGEDLAARERERKLREKKGASHLASSTCVPLFLLQEHATTDFLVSSSYRKEKKRSWLKRKEVGFGVRC